MRLLKKVEALKGSHLNLTTYINRSWIQYGGNVLCYPDRLIERPNFVTCHLFFFLKNCKGSFDITQTDYNIFEQFVGHLSNKACYKVCQEANVLPSLLSL